MLRRLALLTMALAVLVLAGAGSSSGAPTIPSAADLVGEWTPDTSSNSTLAGHSFTISETSQAVAAGDVGPESLDSYEKYCAPQNAATITYFTLSYSWDDQSHMGGCTSSLTQGHLYAWGLTLDVLYVHPATNQGEGVVSGAWGRAASPTANPNYLKLTGHHPAVQFLAHVKFSQVLGKTGSHAAELTTVTGGGELHLIRAPQPCESSDSPSVVSREGALAVKSVKIGGPNVVELDSLTVKPVADQNAADSTFSCDHTDLVRHLAVTVTTSDPSEKDACPVGSPGYLWLADHGSKGDFVKLVIPKCHVDFVLSQTKAKKGSHVAIAATLNEKGY